MTSQGFDRQPLSIAPVSYSGITFCQGRLATDGRRRLRQSCHTGTLNPSDKAEDRTDRLLRLLDPDFHKIRAATLAGFDTLLRRRLNPFTISLLCSISSHFARNFIHGHQEPE